MDYVSCMTDRYTLYPNHTLTEDPVLQDIVRHPNFVKALNVAIDREEINQNLFFGLAKMGQLAPMPNSQYYKPAYAEAFAQFDPAMANQLLDDMGLTERNGDGFRLRSDGEVLKFNIEHAGPRVGVATHEFTEIVVTPSGARSVSKPRPRRSRSHSTTSAGARASSTAAAGTPTAAPTLSFRLKCAGSSPPTLARAALHRSGGDGSGASARTARSRRPKSRPCTTITIP